MMVVVHRRMAPAREERRWCCSETVTWSQGRVDETRDGMHGLLIRFRRLPRPWRKKETGDCGSRLEVRRRGPPGHRPWGCGAGYESVVLEAVVPVDDAEADDVSLVVEYVEALSA